MGGGELLFAAPAHVCLPTGTEQVGLWAKDLSHTGSLPKWNGIICANHCVVKP